MPYYGNLRTTTDIDIMILSDKSIHNEQNLDKLISCMKRNQISIDIDEFKELLATNIHINAYDEKSWVYRLDLKIIHTQIDQISLETLRYVNIYDLNVPIASVETMIAIKISDGYQSDNDLEDIIAIIENNEINVELLIRSLSSVDAITNLLNFLKECGTVRCQNLLKLLEKH